MYIQGYSRIKPKLVDLLDYQINLISYKSGNTLSLKIPNELAIYLEQHIM